MRFMIPSLRKIQNLESEFDFVLVEGSDFTEEGSVFEIDFNGSIAKNLGIPVLLVVKTVSKPFLNW